MSSQRAWISSQEALSWANAALEDEWQAIWWLRDHALTGKIGTRGKFEGNTEVSGLGPFFWVKWRATEDLPPPVESWETGRFEGWASVPGGEVLRRAASGVEFASHNLETLYPGRSRIGQESKRKGRRPHNAWPMAMAEFAAYVHQNGCSDTEKAIKHVRDRLAERGLDMGRETLRAAVLETWQLIQAD